MGRSVIAVVACLAVALAGCQVSTAPKSVLKIREPQATMMRAPWNGQYTLYHRPDERSPKTVVQSAHLRKGDPLGFRRRDSGIVAVADEWEAPIAPGTYEWVMQPDAGQTDPVATAILIAVVVVVAAVAAIVIWSAIDFENNFGGTHDITGPPL